MAATNLLVAALVAGVILGALQLVLRYIIRGGR